MILFDTITLAKEPSDIDQFAPPGEGKTTTKPFLAQKIRTGDHGVVSSVSVWLGTQNDVLPDGLVLAIAQGVIHVEIWDDKEGWPGSKVGSLGDIDIPSIRPRFQGGTVATVENAVVGLKPNSIYHVVFNFSDSKMFIKRKPPGDPEDPVERRETVFFAYWKDAGARPGATSAKFDTVEQPFMLDGDFSVTPEVNYSWEEEEESLPLFMKVTESPDDVPCPEITSVQLGIDSISLSWNSVPFQKYIVEYSSDLQEGNWLEIADDIGADGTETVFVDEDPERRAAKWGFYRVRPAN